MSSHQLRRQLIPRLVLANLVGAVFVSAYLETTAKLPKGLSLGRAAAEDAAILVGAFLLLAALAFIQFRRQFEPEWRWLDEARPPTPTERDAVLTTPARMTHRVFAMWVAVAIVQSATVGLLIPNRELRYGAVTLVAVLLGGTAACAISYLVIEAVLRPAAAVALANGLPKRYVTLELDRRLLLTWALGSGVPLLGVVLTPLIREPRAAVPVWVPMVLLGLIGLLAGIGLTKMTARSIAEPVRRLRVAFGRVQAGDLNVHVIVDDGGEIGIAQTGFNEMTAGLRQRDHLHDLFGRYVGTEVAKRAIEEGIELGGEVREASVLFVDIVGSTALAQRLPATDVVAILNDFFRAVVRCADSQEGWVNKFEGDGALCVFGAPAPDSQHAAKALRAARAMLEELRRLDLDAGIGVSSGHMVAGTVGAEQRYEYTIIGLPVNEAARLTEAAKRRAGRVLASAATVANAGDEGTSWIRTEPLELRGITGAAIVYEPVATSPAPHPSAAV